MIPFGNLYITYPSAESLNISYILPALLLNQLNSSSFSQILFRVFVSVINTSYCKIDRFQLYCGIFNLSLKIAKNNGGEEFSSPPFYSFSIGQFLDLHLFVQNFSDFNINSISLLVLLYRFS